MSSHGKKYIEAAKLVEEEKLYTPAEAVELLRKVNYVKFDPTIEIHLKLGVDQRHADQNVRSTVSLPAGTGKVVRVLVFAQGEKVAEAQAAGADFVGLDDLVKEIEGGWLGFDIAVATPDVMAKISRLGRRLGPRGLMPSPRANTVTVDIGRAVKEVKAGRVEFRVDKTNLLHIPIGKLSFTDEQILQNLSATMNEIMRIKPAAAKGQYIRSIALCSTMSPSIHMDIPSTIGLKVTA